MLGKELLVLFGTSELQQCYFFCLSKETEAQSAWAGAVLQTRERGGVKQDGNVPQMAANPIAAI